MKYTRYILVPESDSGQMPPELWHLGPASPCLLHPDGRAARLLEINIRNGIPTLVVELRLEPITPEELSSRLYQGEGLSENQSQ